MKKCLVAFTPTAGMIKYIFAWLLVASVAMADTQTKFVGSVSTASPGTRDWNNPSNMTADDATYSLLAGRIKNGQDTYTINATMSGNVFTIPTGATINGITVTIEFQEIENGPMGDSVILIIKGGTASGTDHKDETDDWPTSAGGLTTKTWGSTSDLWGLSWTAGDINATNFGVSIKGVEVENSFARPEIDYLQISIDYTPATLILSSTANQTFTAGDSPTAISTQTVIDANPAVITAANDIRIRIPTGFNMIWDTLDLTATIGGNASSKVSGTVSYEDLGKTLVVNVTTNFAASDTITVADLSFTEFTAASPADSLELEVFNDGTVSADDDKTINILAPTLSSAANQTFTTGDSPTAISTQTVIDDIGTPTITATNDIRIRIPTGFNMIWDTLDFTATIGGNASGKVSGTVSYADAGKTLVLDVTANFAASDTITVADLSFVDFTASSSSDNLELVISGASGGTAVTDDKTINILEPTLSSAANQTFTVGDSPTAISIQTVADDGNTPTITSANDIRIRIPAGFNMIWDTLDFTATIGGNASSKVSGTVSYEDLGKTLLLDVTANFAASDTITVADLSFINFTAASATDNLELEVNNDGVVWDLDDKTITILAPTLSSAANQTFTVGDSPTAISIQTVIDDNGQPTITSANDIRIHIPTGFNMIWDTLDFTATIGGNASSKVSGTVSYADAGKTLVVNVTTDFAVSDTITVADLSFISFTAASGADSLELVVSGAGGGTAATDDKTITILGPTFSSAANQTFTVGDSPTAISTQTVIDASSTPTITTANDIRIRIPTGFNMIWDTLDLAATIGGNASSKVSGTVSYEDAGKTLVLAVTTNFAASDTITVADLSFTEFTAVSLADSMELEVNNDGVVSGLDDKTITIVAPTLSSAANQNFTINDSPTAVSVQTVADDGTTPTITAANDIRILIPTGFNMIWDTLDFTATIGGIASGKVSGTVSYADAGKTLVLDVTANFAASDTITVADLSFINFTAVSSADNLELVITGASGGTAATDDKTITILTPFFGYASAGGTKYVQNADNKQGSKFSLSEAGDVDSIYFYGSLGGGAGDPKEAKAVIYQDNAGAPGAWVATTAAVTVTGTTQWWSMGFSTPVSLVSGTYWLVIHHGTKIDVYGDAGSTDQRAYNVDTYSDGPADPFGSATQNDIKLSIYATYIQTSVAVSNATFAFGTEPLNTWLTPESTFVINDATVAENFIGKISQLTAGANVWEIDVPANGADTIRAQWSITSATGPWTDISAYDSDFTFATNVAVNDSVSFWFRIETPTSTASFNEYSSALTVTAVSF